MSVALLTFISSAVMAQDAPWPNKPLKMIVPFPPGGGPMMTDLLGGQIPLRFINQDLALQHVKMGKPRALAATSLQRNPLYAVVPTQGSKTYTAFVKNEVERWTQVIKRAGIKPE